MDVVKKLRREVRDLKMVVAEQAVEIACSKIEHDRGRGRTRMRYSAVEKSPARLPAIDFGFKTEGIAGIRLRSKHGRGKPPFPPAVPQDLSRGYLP